MTIASLDCCATSASRRFSAWLCSSASAIPLKLWLMASNSGVASCGRRACSSPRSMRFRPSSTMLTGRSARPIRKNTSTFSATRNATTTPIRLLRSSHASSTDRDGSTVTLMFPPRAGRFTTGSSGRTSRTNHSGAHRPTL